MGTFDHVLREFCAEVGIADVDTVLTTSEIVVDGIAIQFLALDDESEGLTLFADLGVPDGSRKAEVHRQLLEGNFLWRSTGGAIIGIHPATGSVGVAARVDFEGLSGKLLAEITSRFIQVVEYWSGIVRDAPASASDDGAMAMMNMMRG